jgi:hypothetical protein
VSAVVARGGIEAYRERRAGRAHLSSRRVRKSGTGSVSTGGSGRYRPTAVCVTRESFSTCFGRLRPSLSQPKRAPAKCRAAWRASRRAALAHAPTGAPPAEEGCPCADYMQRGGAVRQGKRRPLVMRGLRIDGGRLPGQAPGLGARRIARMALLR